MANLPKPVAAGRLVSFSSVSSFIRLTIAALVAAGAASAHAANPLSTCFWAGPISTTQPTALGEDGARFLFPEEKATYWLARYNTLPTGSRLTLTRQYAYARHESLNAYKSTIAMGSPRKGMPMDAIADYEIAPLEGSTNPYVLGNARYAAKRLYTVTVLPVDPPADKGARLANTLYVGPATDGPSEIALRVYAPDVEEDLLGGTALPEPKLHLTDGSVLTGQALCKAISSPDQSMPKPLLTQEQWLSPIALGSEINTAKCPISRGTPATPTWRRFFNTANSLSGTQNCGVDPAPDVAPPVQGGFYSTIHNNYISTGLHRSFGKVVVVSGKAPSFRKTGVSQKAVGKVPTQVRYWSMCTGEGMSTTATPKHGCVADYQVPLDRDGRYTIVVSRAADRPANATNQCGVVWLNWGDKGDGTTDATGALLNPDYGMLIMRQMLADDGYAQAIKRISKNADVASTMGEYYPKAEYMASKVDFESRGCAAKRGK
ncbi:MAG: hypothetical protein IPO38_00920 [Rhodocyclaceae bacterium]|nr:hypothetical protein [Rhodocyclaceae bacterium]